MTSYNKIKIIDILRKENIPVVNLNLLRNLTGLINPQSLASCINYLITNGVLERFEKSKYLVKYNLGNDFLIANLAYKPSYVSLETALNLYGILSQFPTEISSITSKRKKTKIINNKLYTFYHINPKLFWGFEKRGDALLALPEKALLDQLYFVSKGIKGIALEELDLSLIKKNVLIQFSRYFPKAKKLNILLNILLKKVWQRKKNL
jgi:hypothetical protein